jgi:hypothetical protein
MYARGTRRVSIAPTPHQVGGREANGRNDGRCTRCTARCGMSGAKSRDASSATNVLGPADLRARRKALRLTQAGLAPCLGSRQLPWLGGIVVTAP